jgi:hypothetical protein
MMKIKFREMALAAFALALCSCAAPTSLKSTWKAPDYQGGPVGKIAVLAVDEGGSYRPMFEGQFVQQLEQQGQPAFKTLGLLTLPEIRADKEAAAAKLRAAGADSILVVRLIDSVNQSSLAPTTRGTTTVTTDSGTVGCFEYVAAYTTSSGEMQMSLKLNVYLDTSLYELESRKKVWSGLTETILREDTDRLGEIQPLVARLVAALRADGLVR